MWCLSLLLLPLAFAANAPVYKNPSAGPVIASSNYGGRSNHTLPRPKIVHGKAFDRIVHIWLENTDFSEASTTDSFLRLAKQGITLTESYALTHPSQPNYAAAAGGDFWGMSDDDWYNIPANMSTIVDLLEEKKISWATYQEGMPTDGFQGFDAQLPNYLNKSAPEYTYWVRKHNPLILYNSVATVPSRTALNRNFNDFAADFNASALPQWMFITPNIVNDAHDTTADFAGKWLDFWLVPLLKDRRFNDDRTLVVLTFDENDSDNLNNRVYTLLLGNAVPKHLHGTKDSTYYTHYSSLSTVEDNWSLGCLGRFDADKMLANVFSFVAKITGYRNHKLSAAQIPFTNASGTIPGPINQNAWFNFLPPNTKAQCAGGGRVFVGPGVDFSIKHTTPIALSGLVPCAGPLNLTSPGHGNGNGNGNGNGHGNDGHGHDNNGHGHDGNDHDSHHPHWRVRV